MSDSWRRDARHPIRTSILLFTAGVVGVTAILYLGPEDDNFASSLAVGAICGAVLVGIGVREMRRQASSTRPRLRRISWFEVLLLAWVGALVVWAVVEHSRVPLQAALWFVGLAGVLLLARSMIQRRGG
jgi:hypothetical protein